jgi:hypothetical protein
MKTIEQHLAPNRNGFESDPFGYSALAWQKWGMAQTVAGFPVDITKPPTSEDLKSPLLWLSQAHAMSEAAVAVIGREPNLSHIPLMTKGVCHSQYFAVALMLVGYSLEICLKGMLIIKLGIEGYTAEEKKYHHHKLDELSAFVPGLSERDRAILKVLTHFVSWAGRYPDPGSGRESNTEEIFTLSEKHQISGNDLFALSARIMAHASEVCG